MMHTNFKNTLLCFVCCLLFGKTFAQTDSTKVFTDSVFTEEETKFSHQIQGNLATEASYFYKNPYRAPQKNYQVSGLVDFTYTAWNPSKCLRLIVHPFARLTTGDPSRSHVDLREAYLSYFLKKWDFNLGFQKKSYGFAQSFSQMNVLNQNDDLETPWSVTALGQPMADIGFSTENITLRAYVLPFFRKKILPNTDSRLYIFPLEVSQNNAPISPETPAWSFTFKGKLFRQKLETDLVFYKGLSNLPNVSLLPNYTLQLAYNDVSHLGLGLQYIFHSLIIHAEGSRRWQNAQNYLGYNFGLEYPLANIFSTKASVILTGEYYNDGWKRKNNFPFDNVLQLGSRLDFGDVQSSILFFQFLYLQNTNAVKKTFTNIEYSRRILNSWEIKLNWIFYAGKKIPITDNLTVLQHVSNLNIKLSKYF